jgi:hypothetical protein
MPRCWGMKCGGINLQQLSSGGIIRWRLPDTGHNPPFFLQGLLLALIPCGDTHSIDRRPTGNRDKKNFMGACLGAEFFIRQHMSFIHKPFKGLFNSTYHILINSIASAFETAFSQYSACSTQQYLEAAHRPASICALENTRLNFAPDKTEQCHHDHLSHHIPPILVGNTMWPIILGLHGSPRVPASVTYKNFASCNS